MGVPIDRKCLEDLAAECQGTMNEIAPRVWKLSGEEFDISNDGTIRRVLYEKLKAPVVGMTEKELPAVDDDALWMLEKQGWEIAKLIREWNAPQKILTTYTTSIVELTDAHGILHAQIDQGGARTGRVSSRQPNLQNVPVRSKLGRRVREAFVTRPGMVRYCLDYSQIELRILAHLSQDPLLLKIYREGLDAHSATAIEVFGTDGKIDGIDMRRIGKILNFGTAFGMTHLGLMRNVNKDLPEGQPPIDEARATRFREQFYQKYSGITLFQQRLWERLRRSEGRFQNLFGRPRRMPGILSKNRREMAAAERGSVASLVQGSAADLVKYSMCAVADYLDAGQAACECSMVLMIHDDLQFDMTFEGSAKTVRDIHRLMEQTCQGRLSVPIVTDVEYFTDNWANKKKMKL
jgi:DNA polymerase-1